MDRAITKEEIKRVLTEELSVNSATDLLVFVNQLNEVGPIAGGTGAFLGALLETAETVIMPAFTFQTMVIPAIGPPDNAITYGSGDELNARAEIFWPNLKIHADCGAVAEEMRKMKGTLRSTHPIYSFIGRGRKAEGILSAQTLDNPLGVIAALETLRARVLLVSVDHRHNFALHLAESHLGRKTFIRWALTPGDIEELHQIPGCMEGFNAIWGDVLGLAEVSQIGMARAESYPLRPLLAFAEKRLVENPNFLLCDKPSCLSCRAREVHSS